MTTLKMSKLNFSATISNIYSQFTPVNRGRNSAYFMFQKLFRRYFRFARMTSLKISKFNFAAAIGNIYAQFAPMNRELNCAYINAAKSFLESTFGMRKLKWKNQFSATIRNIYAQVEYWPLYYIYYATLKDTVVPADLFPWGKSVLVVYIFQFSAINGTRFPILHVRFPSLHKNEELFNMTYTMVADLCHCAFSLFRGEGEKTKAKRRNFASFRLRLFASK